MNRQSIVFAILFIGGLSLAKSYLSIGILGSAFIGAIAGALGVFVEALIEKMFPKKENVQTGKYEPSLPAENTVKESEFQVSDEPYYYGFGGWLYFYTIGQMYTLYSITTGIKDWFYLISSDDLQTLRFRGFDDYADRFIVLGLIGTIFSIFIILTILIVWVFALRLSRFYKRLNIIYILGNSVGVFLLIGFMVYLNYYTNEILYSFSDLSGIIAGATLFGVIWIPYFIKSKRVKNTFIK